MSLHRNWFLVLVYRMGSPGLVSRFLRLKEWDPSKPSLSLQTLVYLLLIRLVVIACLKLASIWWIFNSLEQTGWIQLSETAAVGGMGGTTPHCLTTHSFVPWPSPLVLKAYGGHHILVLLWPDGCPGLPRRLHSSSRPNPFWGVMWSRYAPQQLKSIFQSLGWGSSTLWPILSLRWRMWTHPLFCQL